MKRLVLCMILSFLLLFCSCKTGEEELPVPSNGTELPTCNDDIGEVRRDIAVELSRYLEQNEAALTKLANGILQSPYDAISYYQDGACVWNGGEYFNVPQSELPTPFGEFYLLESPPFVGLERFIKNEWFAETEAAGFRMSYSFDTSSGVRITGILCYGSGLSKKLIVDSYYVEIIPENWVIYFSYDEDSIYYEQLKSKLSTPSVYPLGKTPDNHD